MFNHVIMQLYCIVYYRDSPLIASAIGRGGTSSQNVFLYQNRPSPMVPLKVSLFYLVIVVLLYHTFVVFL